MSRSRGHRLKITGTLEAMSPVHVGGMHDSPEVDLPLARDGQDRMYLPGTSLAGAMRQWTRRRFEAAIVNALWGSQAVGGRGEDAASRAFVDDAVMVTPATTTIPPEVWDGVGIDREYGRAADRIKFDRAVLPRGSAFTFAMTVDLPPADQEATTPAAEMRAVVGHLVEALRGGRIGFGAAQTRGLGRLRLSDVEIIDEDWSTRAGVLAVLTDASPPVRPADLIRRRR